jgi:hypothetical protein
MFHLLFFSAMKIAATILYDCFQPHTVKYAGFDPLDFEGNVPTFAPHESLILIV